MDGRQHPEGPAGGNLQKGGLFLLCSPYLLANVQIDTQYIATMCGKICTAVWKLNIIHILGKLLNFPHPQGSKNHDFLKTTPGEKCMYGAVA